MKQGMIDLKLTFHEVWGSGFVRSLFGYNRLVTLLGCLHFDHKNMRSASKEKDPLAPIREVWDRFERSLKRQYTPGSFLTIDEQLVPFDASFGYTFPVNQTNMISRFTGYVNLTMAIPSEACLTWARLVDCQKSTTERTVSEN